MSENNQDMVIVGRVAIVPKGDYNIEAVYKRLDLVRYGLGAYVARKGNTGQIPYPEDTEFWMLIVSGIEGAADKITYDNELSELTAEDVQSALDELASMLKEDYVKKTDYAVAPTEDNPGRAGVVKPDGETITADEDGTIHGSTKVDVATVYSVGTVKPDGKTIQIDDEGTITGTAVRTFESVEEYEAAVEAGEIEPGMTVNIKNDFQSLSVIDSELSETSENAVQNKVVTAALNEIKDSLGGITFSVTESGLVRASWEDEEGA